MTVNHRTVCTTEKSWPRYVETTECDCTLNQTCPGTFFYFLQVKGKKNYRNLSCLFQVLQ